MSRRDISRREFVKRAGITVAAAGGLLAGVPAAAQDAGKAVAPGAAARRRRTQTTPDPVKPFFGERPNLLLLMSDQHNPFTMSCAGHPVIRTPHMDRLAREGVRFAHAYTPSPLCVPARVALLTGRYGHSTGLLTNSGHLLGGEPTFPQVLRAAGYHTCITGKIHLAQGGRPGTPECDQSLHEMGFDDALANTGKVAEGVGKDEDSYRKYLRERGVFEKFQEDYTKKRRGAGSPWYAAPSVLSEEDYHDAYIGRITRDWLASYKDDKPFFCWCNWGGPHSPWDAPGRYATMYDPAKMDPPIDDPLEGAPTLLHKKQKAQTGAMPPDAWRACRANYYGMINVVDDAIAAMLDSLEKRGAIENTIVIYTSDHGEMLFNHGFHGKSLMYEESAGVPLIVRWPKHFQKGAASEALTSALDLVPALLSVAGAPAMKAIHGVSVLPVLTGRSSAHREEVFSEMGTMKMLRRGDWKYVYDPAWNVQQLLNLREDPREMKNLSGAPDQAARERDMRDRILQWMIETESRPNTTGGTARE